ncbi:outer membrane beta-barrel protein [Mucilaginibacter sp. UR6-11]|uniref:outer membrane beta-barrel protein n=1 Tax=Mucilaginibacter sp. UR6-11 TaxID=1435644 RepID=UPI001E619305|nr:outer membrane beta-barrel protein [Mucilaginibacter sp. UR6-11]MCC8424206.1 PorT family protein [Mucilaginibacter sp. UR6-11]
MKRLMIAALLCGAANLGFAQKVTTVTTTTTINGKDTIVSTTTDTKVKPRLVFKAMRDSLRHNRKSSGFNFGLTFARFDLGLTTLIDNGSFTLSPKNDFLSYRSWKSSNVGFDLLQFGYRFTPNFKVYLSGGFDWMLLRLRKDITIQRNAPVLTYVNDTIHFSKNRFSSTYLRVPLSFEFRTNEYSNGKRFRFIVGPEAGILLGARVKQISDERGKQKLDDDYHFAKVRYGAFTRIGYGSAGLFAKYYFNDMFENSPAQEGLKNFAVGLTFGF